MSSACPPQSPAVAKSEVAIDGECPLLAATFAYWDNILGPRVHHIWAPKGDHLMLLSDGDVTFLANHTLNGEILRSAECGAVDVKFFVLAEKGVIIVSLIFDGELKGDKNTCALSIILPQTELAFYLPLHTVCVERLKHAIRKGRIWMQKGYNIIAVLSLEIVPIMELLASMKTHSVPEDIDDSTGSFVLPFRQVLYSPYPTTHIDVDINTVKQMPPCHEHTYNQRAYMRSELNTLWKTDSEEDIPPDTIIPTDDTFTPDLNIFQDVMHTDTLVKSFIDEVFMLKPGLSLRSAYLAQFLLLLHRKALTLLKYIEDETQKGKKPFRSLRNLKTDLDLTVEGDLNIVMAFAEKLRAGLHSFVFGKPFYTSMQERDVLMNF
ncbi:guanine nucleotide exchange factor C9orf72 homolog isoform X2 [Corythoichthys intestinalis]|uniref:guanine nucleotide exchange factor C9orf72 homolog isoform X2 n=1 Tax=Corythoichthys intestinalis TaxID=161448 RepID=UPI0025A55B29|nr:guanine nucleotide exchange factor C9orf72 homolog isoform X2 [Corythoichthys intestinalis]